MLFADSAIFISGTYKELALLLGNKILLFLCAVGLTFIVFTGVFKLLGSDVTYRHRFREHQSPKGLPSASLLW